MCVFVQTSEGRSKLLLLVLQLSNQLRTTVPAALSPDRCMDRHLETSQIHARYSRGPFTEEIIEIKIVVPLTVETETILKDSMSISFTVLKNNLSVRK